MMIDLSYLQQHPLVSGFFEVVKERFRLTKREIEIVKLLSLRGSSNKELGEAFCVSEKTMKNHVANIMRKFNVHSSREIQAIILRETMLPVFLNAFHSPNTSMKGNREYAALSH